MAAKTFNIEDIAAEMDIKPRTIRKILRNNESMKDKQPGRGGRWTFAEKDIAKVKAIIDAGRASNSIIDLDDIEV